MIPLQRNKWKTLWVGIYHGEEIIYKTDENGEIVTIPIDGEEVAVEIGKRPAGYKILEDPIKVNFKMLGDEIQEEIYGYSTTDFGAMIITSKGQYDFSVEDLFWEEEPEVDENGNAEGDTADWRIVGIPETLNYDKYLLDAVTK